MLMPNIVQVTSAQLPVPMVIALRMSASGNASIMYAMSGPHAGIRSAGKLCSHS